MAKPQQAPLPQELVIGSAWRVVFDAIDPATGAQVGGVVVSNANLTATNEATGDTENLTPGPFMLVPGPNTVEV
jgi:hypothetical protein